MSRPDDRGPGAPEERPLLWPPTEAPKRPPGEEPHLLAYLQAAGWALMGYACAPKDTSLTTRGACASGLADGLWGSDAVPPPVTDDLLLSAYMVGFRAGRVVRFGNSSPAPRKPKPEAPR